MSSMLPPSNIGIHLSLSGQAQTIAGLNATSAATARLRQNIIAAGDSEHLATLKHQAYNQAWFTVRRLIYAGTLALGAAATAVTVFGLKFNSSMQQNMVAYTHFLGSTQLARDYLNKLYDLAATTPFTFEGLTSATKRLLAFGYTGDQAFRTMQDIGDAAAGLGAGQEGIDRMTLAFGQMLTNGRILGGELRQLSEVGINARKYLQQAFHLTADQMARIGQLHIPARQGIEAILRGMEGEFGGFAVKQSQTFTGLLSTLHDYAQKLFGAITKPLFDKMADTWLPKLVKLTKDLPGAFETGGWAGMVKAFDDAVGAGGKIVLVWGRLSSIGHSLWIIWSRELWPALTNLLRLLSPLLALLWPISWALKIMADHTTTFGIALKLLIVYLFATRVAVILFGKTLRWYYTITRLIWSSIFLNLVPAYRAWIAWTFAMNRAQNGQFLAGWKNNTMLARLSRGVITYARNLRILAMTAMASARIQAAAWIIALGPIAWIIAAIVAIGAALVVLYFKWDWFHDKVNSIFFWIRDHWKLLIAIFLGPFWVVGFALFKFWDVIWSKIQWIWNKAKALWGWIRDHIPFGILGGNDRGSSTNAIINPTSKQIDNTVQTRQILTGGMTPRRLMEFDSSRTAASEKDRTIQVNSKIEMNKRTVAEAVTEHKLYKDALR